MIVKFKEIADYVAGQSPESKYYSNTEGIPFLQGSRTFGLLYPTIDTYTKKITKIAKKGDILMSVRAPVGDLNIAKEDLCIGRGLSAISSKTGNNIFLFYSLKYNIQNLIRQSSGTTFDSITRDVIENMNMIIPDDKSIHLKISKLLFDIDLKIDINNKINAELESMAKTLYDYWFLQFEFPNENGKPYKSSGGKMVWNEELKREIPEGWEVRTVKDCADVVSGYPFKTETYSKDGKYKIYTIGNVQDGYIDDTCPNKIDFIPDDMDRGCILKPCDIIMSLTGNVGRVGLVYTKNALLNQRVLKVEPLEGYHNFLYLLFRNSSFSRVMQRIASGTSQKNLSPNQVCDFKFAIPKKSLLDLFNKKVNGFIKAIVNNLSQNQELTSLRDFLLPLLMNGQVKFKD